MKLKLAPVLAAVVTATLAGALVAPADAAAKTTVSIHVQTVKKTALKDVAVLAEKGSSFVFVGMTNGKGDVTKSAGLEGKLSAGTWRITLRDVSQSRNSKNTAYAIRSFSAKLTGGKNNALGTKALQAGSHLTGKVTAPSGRAIRNAEIYAFTDAKSQDIANATATTAKGTYNLGALATDKYWVRTYTGGKAPSAAKIVTVKKAGSTTKGISFSKIQVGCSTGFTATSQNPGAVTVSVDSSAAGFGLTNPGGSVTIAVDGQTIETVPWKDIATFSKTYSGQASGSHSYSVKYTGGDCYDWSKKSTVSVADVTS